MASGARKEDLVLIARRRRPDLAEAALWALKAPALESMVPDLTEPELALVRERQRRRAEHRDLKTPFAELQARVSARGLSSFGRTRGGLIDALLEAEARPAFAPDPDQAALLERWDDPLLVVSAGPGSGKTTTLTALVARILRERPGARVLVLAYNRNAERILRERLGAQGVVPVPNRAALSAEPGLRLMTFDKYGHWRSRDREDGSSSLGFTLDDLDLGPGPGEAPQKPAPPARGPGEPGPGPDPGPPGPGTPPARGSGPPGPGPGRDGNYRFALERAAQHPLGPGESWDWVVVDEAQDVLPTHAAIIARLQEAAGHLVVAGDPRQEIYAGAVWFGRLWASLKGAGHTLRFNHRSAPAIVAFLNRYSRLHFPTLHHDQLPARADGLPGEAAFELVAGPGRADPDPAARLILAGRRCAALMAQRGPGEAYAIAPVTLRKYRHGPAVDALRQALHEARPEALTRVLGDGSDGVLDDGAYCVGTAFKLKGTERRRVAVFGLCAPYVKYGLDAVLLRKLVFVALSRAQDSLCGVLDEAPGRDSLLAELLPELAPGAERKTRGAQRLSTVDVSNDLAPLDCWELRSGAAESFEPVQLSQRADEDFVGLFVEASLALAAGVPLRVGRIESTHGRLMVGVFPVEDPPGVWSRVAVFDQVAMPNGLAELERLRRDAESRPAYGYAQLCRTVSISRPWTVSERLALEGLPESALEAPLRRLLAHLGADRLGCGAFGGPASREIAIHRSPRTAGRIVGQTDFALGSGEAGRVVELKHARPAAAHLAQAAIYASLRGAREALVLNTLEGSATAVAAVPAGELDRVARAALALKRAAQAAAEHPRRLADETKAAVLVAIGAETDGAGLLLEVGALGFDRSGRVAGSLHRLGRGLAEAKPGLLGTGLEVADRAALVEDQAEMKGAIAAWAACVAPARALLHWGADLAGLGLAGEDAQDVSALYQAWLGGGQKGSCALSSAVGRALGPAEPFEPGRAFETAAMTAAVFSAIVCASGAL